MAETLSKRQREETKNEDCSGEDHKRQKSYNHVLSILDSEEEEPTQDLSSLITTLQHEISSENSGFDPLPSASSEIDPDNIPATTSTSVEDYSCTTSSFSSSPSSVVKDEQEDKEKVMRHLLEASDDELGIPNRDLDVGGFDFGFDEDCVFNGKNGFCFSDTLWELEDEAANYYTLLQSELFM